LFCIGVPVRHQRIFADSAVAALKNVVFWLRML
jgi:hypothetical protein